MAEWRLFPEGEVPRVSTVEFFRGNDWVPTVHQAGHAERTAMADRLLREVLTDDPGIRTLSDLGCGDGVFLECVAHLFDHAWGFDAGKANVEQAVFKGLTVTEADITDLPAQFLGDVVTACEVVEHMADPHRFLRNLPADRLLISSPSAETDQWHYVDHTWAWDLDGYRVLAEGSGWSVLRQVECDGGVNTHSGVTRPQRFQALYAVRR